MSASKITRRTARRASRPIVPLSTLLACAAIVGSGSVLAVADKDWPSYNRTLASDRYSPLDSIDTGNVAQLAQVCTYDTGQMVGFQTGLIEVQGLIYGTTEKDTFALDADTCVERWRAHEDFTSGTLRVNRGVAYLDGRIFRGTKDGRVLAYQAKTGKPLWQTTIADPARGESVPAAPIAWKGLVFVGNAGGDNKGVKGRMYALDAATGRIVWEFFLVPREAGDVARGPAATDDNAAASAATWNNAPGFPITGGATWTSYTLDERKGLLYVPGGNPGPDFVGDTRQGDNTYTDSVVVLDARSGKYLRHVQLVPHDLHDWDVSTAPAIIQTRGGREVMAIAPKNGHLYGFDTRSNTKLYQGDVTTIENADAPPTPEGTHFCPGTQGGAEWNGVAFNPAANLLYTGEVDWCVTIHTVSIDTLDSVPIGKTWSGDVNGFGVKDPTSSGWFTASDADTGEKVWQYHSPSPLLGGVTPTAGGLVFFGDMGGMLHAFDSASGEPLWAQQLDGAVGGGVITYDAGHGQKVAVAAGMTSPIWTTPQVTARVVVLGLPDNAEK